MPVITPKVASGGNDGSSFNGALNNSVGSVRVGEGSGGADASAWFRFQVNDIASGDTINSAVLRVRASATDATDFHFIVSCEDADNPGAISDQSDFDSRVRTTAQNSFSETGGISTSGGPNSDGWYEYDIKDPLQEVVNRGGRSPGDYVNAFMDGDTAHPDQGSNDYGQFISFDGTPADAAELVIDYTASGGSTVDLDGDLSATGLLSGALSRTRDIAASLSRIRNLSGSIISAGELIGALSADLTLSGSIAATAALSGVLSILGENTRVEIITFETPADTEIIFVTPLVTEFSFVTPASTEIIFETSVQQ